MAKKTSSTRREDIVETAAKLFKQKGYAATTMREIAEQVGIEAASIYNHIKGKDELLAEICFRVSNAYIAQLTAIEMDDSSPIEKIKALIRLHIRIVFEDVDGISVANNEWKHLPESALTSFKAARRDYESRFAKIIEQGIEQGDIQKVNASVALFTILSAVRWVELWYKSDRQIAPQVLEDDIVSLLLNGLQK
ncbi:MAG: TetR family transcriptional regulator [Saprospiraceae bacterium]|nr:TetR family transcriptional regulator [Saprospiraceae bacterium]